MRFLVGILTVVVVAIACTLITWYHSNAQHVARVQREMRTLTAQNKSLHDQVVYLSNQVGNLNVPTDPLSAYNDVCDADLTNDNTGVAQTYYYPCTNSAQTIPQPGN